MNGFEQVNNESVIMRCVENSVVVEGKNQIRKFFFDHVLDTFSSQDDVFNESGVKRLLQLTIEG